MRTDLVTLLDDGARIINDLEKFGSLQLFDVLDRFAADFGTLKNPGFNAHSYPPENIIQLSDNSWLIELAVAGFSKDQITVRVEDGRLFIKGEQKEALDSKNQTSSSFPRFYKRGIAQRQFELVYPLPDHSEITEAKVNDGLLQVTVTRELPEKAKPKLITVK